MSFERKYIILRDLQQGRLTDPAAANLRGPEPTWGDGPTVLREPRIDVETTDASGLGELVRDPQVRLAAEAMPTRLVEPVDSAGQNKAGDSWGIAAVRAAASSYTGAGVLVAVLDTGIDAAHRAFAGIDLTVKDFTRSGPQDGNGHGTHCAGTFFGRDVDRSRIGIAKGVDRAFIGKVLDDRGRGSSDMVLRGLYWAAARGAKVISMSLGFDYPRMVRQEAGRGLPEDLAVSRALRAYGDNLRVFDALVASIRSREHIGEPGCVVVAAAGNESRRDVNPEYQMAVSLPAAADRVVSVGALTRSECGYDVAPFSNSFPSVCAPGVAIKSAGSGGGLRTSSGTSMACPHVAGIAALWWEKLRELGVRQTASAVEARLMAACLNNELAPGLGPSDRGDGLVTAP
jgi:subtilisin family serine protease